MRNLKKFLALVLAMLMVVSAGATVSAYSDVAEDDAYAAAIAALTEYGIVNGTELGEAEDGSDALFEPDADVTRWQMALMMARALAPEVTNEEWAEGMEIFADVDQWYGAIAYAYVEGIVNGVSTESLVFKPNDGIKYQDGLIMALRALGYDVDVSGVVYWLDAWTQAKQIGLTDGIAISSGSKTMTRGEMAQLIYNMVQLPFADGSESLAIKYYGSEAPIGEPTTFVITATPGQAYVKGQHTDVTLPEGETAATLVGLQKLEAGIPAGDIIYFEAEALGIAADKADDYLHYAVNLYDYDAQYNDYSAYEIVAEPVVVRSNKLAADGSTIKVGGYTYYPVASLTDAARRNEIVVFTGDADKKDALVLLKNKDGNIVDFDGDVVASYVYTLGATNYYVYQPVEGNPTVISETKALDMFGVKTADDAVFTEYETKTAADLKLHKDGADNNGRAYQLSLFDDNADGKFDRAIYEAVYMSVYTGKDSDGYQIAEGTAGNAPYNDKKPSFTDTSVQSKGKVFTYTYNSQLKKVNVLEVLSTKTGVVSNVDIKNQKVTIGGTTYTLGNPNREYLMGADLIYTDGKGYGDIKDNGVIDYADLSVFYNIGSNYEYYEYNGYLIAGKKLTAADEDANWKYFLSAGAVSYDSTAIYVDGYVNNGEKGTIEITVIDADVDAKDNIKKDTAIADMNIFDLGEYLATVKELFAMGNLFRVVAREDGTYRLLSSKVTQENAATELTPKDKFDLALATDDYYEFNGGISDKRAGDKYTRIRTKDDTAFFFIKYAPKANGTGNEIVDLDVISGAEIEDGDKIYNRNNTYIYADLLGWGNGEDTVTYPNGYEVKRANSGVANVVYVYYKNESDIKGFDITTGIDDYSIVYVTKVDGTTGLSIVPGSEVNDSAEPWYYKMADKNAIDMETGKVIDVVYMAKNYVKTEGFFKMDENGVISALDSKVAEEKAIIDQLVPRKVTKIDPDNQYVTLKLDGANVIEVGNKVTTIYHTATKTGDIVRYTNNSDSNVDNDIREGEYVAMLALDNDEVVVLVEVPAPTVYCDCCDDCDCVGTECAADCDCPCCDEGPVTNATYTATPKTGGTPVTRDIVVSGANFEFGKLENVVIDIGAPTAGCVTGVSSIKIAQNTANNVIYNSAKYVVTNGVSGSTINFSVGETLVDGTFDAETLDAGLYLITINLTDTDDYERVVTVILDTRA